MGGLVGGEGDSDQSIQLWRNSLLEVDKNNLLGNLLNTFLLVYFSILIGCASFLNKQTTNEFNMICLLLQIETICLLYKLRLKKKCLNEFWTFPVLIYLFDCGPFNYHESRLLINRLLKKKTKVGYKSWGGINIQSWFFSEVHCLNQGNQIYCWPDPIAMELL